MYLKRLDLQGFKSFANHTVFDFGPGITAVVGPNGSGKSNVAEALRWVLGEQSSRSVRARRLEDVIFSGSSQKSPVGMAEVAMTLDNAEGWLPVDYSEVVISRRVFRSGESEYLINKNKVRLRDVMDLLLRAQVGQNSYAFMGQGLVDEVLVMRPDERRRLLEEAADVRLLRQRLDEARDRLSATRENLERVNLLIEEIGPRLAQLEKQASRAIEHGRLARELSDTLRELYTQQWTVTQDALTAARASFDQKQQELAVANDEARACEEGLTALSTAVVEREQELASRRQRHRALSDQVHNLEQRLGFDRERREGQTRRRAEIEAELQSLRDERADLQHAIANDQERALAVAPEIEEAKSLIATRRQELNSLEQEQSGLRRRIAESEDRMRRAERAIADAESGLRRIADEEARDENERGRRADRKQTLVAQLSEIGREFRVLQENLRGLEREIEDTEQERIGLAAMVESGRTDLRRLEDEALQTESRLNQLRGREELLRRLHNAQEGVDSGARFLLGEGGAQRTQVAEGLIGLIRDIIRVPPGLERAIEAALAENLQALVFENLKAAVDALQLLEQGEQGRALVYPLDAVKVSPPLNLIREKGLVDVASRLVRCEPPYRPLIDALLGRTIVVEDINFGMQVLRRGLGAVVTMDGYLLRPNGAISGGVAKAASESFSRQRELDELPDQIAATAARKADLDHRVERERDAFEGSTRALLKVEPLLQQLRNQHNQAQIELHENRGRLIMMRSEARSLWSELSRDDASADGRARLARYAEERAQAEAEAAAAAAELQQDRQALTLLTSHRSEAIDAVSEAAAAHADLEGEARSLTRQIELVQSSLARVEARLKDREESLRTIDAEMKTMGERDDTETVELAALSQELQALTTDLEPAEGELQHLMSRERSMRDQLNGARSRLLAAERAHLETENAVALRSEEIAALRETILAEGFQIEGHSVLPMTASRPEPNPQSAPDVQAPQLPEIRGAADIDIDALRQRVTQIRNRIRSLGPINEQAQADYGESKERYDFLNSQVEDLRGSEETLLTAIEELENNIRERLTETFAIVDREFQRYFASFFNGGVGKLVLTDPDDMANTGIEITGQPAGKRVHALAMLSGGERALTALALLLALLEAHPSPICVLDEVDAALDESNVGRFVDAVKDLGKKTQFIVITHNPRTVEAADSIYGVSMGADSTSRILSVRLDN